MSEQIPRNKLENGMKVTCTRSGLIGRITKLGGKSSKVRIPVFGTGKYFHKQISNENLVRR